MYGTLFETEDFELSKTKNKGLENKGGDSSMHVLNHFVSDLMFS